jgi:3-deoxy-7-phosphoheptulonate synthase
MLPTQDLNVVETVRLIAPRALKDELPMCEACNATVVAGRAAVQRILRHEDPRFLVVVGPCSIHDRRGALEYAGRLVRLREQLHDHLARIIHVSRKSVTGRARRMQRQ